MIFHWTETRVAVGTLLGLSLAAATDGPISARKLLGMAAIFVVLSAGEHWARRRRSGGAS